MTTPHTQTLHTLYELHTRSVNAGGEGFWPEEVRPYSLQGSRFYVYERYGGASSMTIHIRHTLDIVNAHAERWLRKLGWVPQESAETNWDTDEHAFRWSRSPGISTKSTNDQYQAVIFAIRYEVERMEQETE